MPVGAEGWRAWGGWFAILVVLGTTWAVALPSYSGPDEQAHITKAAAVVRGQLGGEVHQSQIGAFTVVQVPEIFGDGPPSSAKRCFSGHPTRPADCAARVQGGTAEVDAVTYVGQYPPAYYAVVGLPTLVAPGAHSLVLMRLMSVLLGAAFLASALASAAAVAGTSRLLPGVLVAVTPMVSYLTGVVNPNGLEIVAALSAATAVAALGVADPAQRPRLVRRAVVGFVACALSRTPAVAFAVLAVALPRLAWPAVARLRWRDLPGVRAAAGAVVATLVAVGGWAAAMSTGGLGDALTREPLRTSIGETGRFLRQAIGVFGELDAPVPTAAWLAWLGMALVLVIAGLVRGEPRQRLAIALAVAATLTIPVVAQGLAVPPVGARWQGRYGLAIAVVVPVVAAAAIRTRRRDQRWVLGMSAVLVAAQLVAVASVARRYRVGVDGPVWFLGAGSWRPAWVTGTLVLVAAAAWIVLVVRAGHLGPGPTAPEAVATMRRDPRRTAPGSPVDGVRRPVR